MFRRVEMALFAQSCEPSLGASLFDHAPFAPTRFGIIEAFVRGSHSDLVRTLRLRIEPIEVFDSHGIIGASGFRCDPRVAPVTVRITECSRIGKEEQWFLRQRFPYPRPVNREFL